MGGLTGTADISGQRDVTFLRYKVLLDLKGSSLPTGVAVDTELRKQTGSFGTWASPLASLLRLGFLICEVWLSPHKVMEMKCTDKMLGM